MKHFKLPLQIDTDLPLPVNIQIKNQIKLLIAKGLLKPSDVLPSTKMLAFQLSVNRNTIQSVYSQLKEENILIMEKGKSAQIASENEINNSYLKKHNLSFVQEIVENIWAADLDVEDILLSGIAYNQLFGTTKLNKKNYLFIECKNSACVFYLDEIKLNTKSVITTIDLNTSTSEELFKAAYAADIIVTQTNLLDRIQEIIDLNNKRTIAINDTKDLTMLFDMIQ